MVHDTHLFPQPGISPGQNLIHRDATQKPEVVENLRRAQHHAAQGIVSGAYREAGFFPDSLVLVSQAEVLRALEEWRPLQVEKWLSRETR